MVSGKGLGFQDPIGTHFDSECPLPPPRPQHTHIIYFSKYFSVFTMVRYYITPLLGRLLFTTAGGNNSTRPLVITSKIYKGRVILPK